MRTHFYKLIEKVTAWVSQLVKLIDGVENVTTMTTCASSQHQCQNGCVITTFVWNMAGASSLMQSVMSLQWKRLLTTGRKGEE